MQLAYRKKPMLNQEKYTNALWIASLIISTKKYYEAAKFSLINLKEFFGNTEYLRLFEEKFLNIIDFEIPME